MVTLVAPVWGPPWVIGGLGMGLAVSGVPVVALLGGPVLGRRTARGS